MQVSFFCTNSYLSGEAFRQHVWPTPPALYRAEVGLRSVQAVVELSEEDVVDDRTLAGTGDAGDTGEKSQRNAHVDVAEVVMAGPAYREPAIVRCAAAFGHGDTRLTGDVASRGRPAGGDLAG